MGDLLVSLIRTYVPAVVGAVIGWVVVTFGFEVPKEQVAELTAYATTAALALYYLAARLLERWHPVFGWLLGSKKQPEYPPEPDRPEEPPQPNV